MKNANNSESKSISDLAEPEKLQTYRKLVMVNVLSRLLHVYPKLPFKYDGLRLIIAEEVAITVDQGEDPEAQAYLPEFDITVRFGITSAWKHNRSYGKVNADNLVKFTTAAIRAAITMFHDIEEHLNVKGLMVKAK